MAVENAVRLAAISILLLAAWPVLRMVVSRPFRNRLAAHPKLPAKILACVIAYGLIVIVLALAPLAWPVAAAVSAVLVFAFAWWRARPDYGRHRGLPPGSLAATSLAMVDDDRYLLDQAAKYGPVFKTGRFGQAIVCILGIERAADLLKRHSDSLTSGALPFSALIEGGFIRYMPKDRHGHYRRLLVRSLTPDWLNSGQPIIESTARSVLQRAAKGKDVQGLDPKSHLLHYTTEAMLRLFLGFDAHDPRLQKILDLYPEIASAELSKRHTRQVRRVYEEILGIFKEAAEHARLAPTAAHSLLHRLARIDPASLEDSTLLGNLVYMIETGGRDTADLLLWSLKMLGDHPEIAARIAACETGLAQHVVAETLRLEQSEYVMRKTVRPIRAEGFIIPKGWLVRFCVRESHRDSQAFTSPEQFDPDRFHRNDHDPKIYAPLGIGTHTCLGQGLVLAMASTFIDVLGRGFDWHIAEDGPRIFGSFHWMPSPSLRLAITERA